MESYLKYFTYILFIEMAIIFYKVRRTWAILGHEYL